MYLPESALQSLAETIRATLPRATLICDLMSRAFARWFGAGLARELHRLGSPFVQRREHPRRAIEAGGFRRREVYSIVGRACEAGTLRFPRWLLNTLLREMRDGYAVWVFEPAATQQALRVGHH